MLTFEGADEAAERGYEKINKTLRTMNTERTWKRFDQLLTSPSVSGRKSNCRQRIRKQPTRKHGSDLHQSRNDDGWQIQDSSDEDATGSRTRKEGDTQHETSFTPSLAQTLNPAEVTIERRNQSDTEIEDISEDEACRQSISDCTSDSSESNDCLAIHCRKTKMTRLKFIDKNDIKRRRITDEMDVSFAAISSKARACRLDVSDNIASPKQFKTLTPRCSDRQSESELSVMHKSVLWKSFEATFTEQDMSCIEELPSSPETDDRRNDPRALFNIEDLPSSADEEPSSSKLTTCNGQTAASPKSFYVASPNSHGKGKLHPAGSPLGTLAMALNEKSAQLNSWQRALTFGTGTKPTTTVKIDSIEHVYGRVMVRFYTTTTKVDSGIEQRTENVLFMGPHDKRLKTIRAGMEVALETDDTIAPHLTSRDIMVHLGVTKLGAIPSRGVNH